MINLIIFTLYQELLIHARRNNIRSFNINII